MEHGKTDNCVETQHICRFIYFNREVTLLEGETDFFVFRNVVNGVVQKRLAVIHTQVIVRETCFEESLGKIPVTTAEIKKVLRFHKLGEQTANPRLNRVTGGRKRLRIGVVKILV